MLFSRPQCGPRPGGADQVQDTEGDQHWTGQLEQDEQGYAGEKDQAAVQCHTEEMTVLMPHAVQEVCAEDKGEQASQSDPDLCGGRKAEYGKNDIGDQNERQASQQ